MIMFYSSEDLKVVLPSDSMDGCSTLRDALREGFLLYFKELEKHYNLVYRIRDLRFIADKGVGDLAYNISFKGFFSRRCGIRYSTIIKCVRVR